MRCSETTRACIDLTTVDGSRDAAAGAGEHPRLEIQGFLIYVHPRLLPGTLRALSTGEPGRRVRHADAPWCPCLRSSSGYLLRCWHRDFFHPAQQRQQHQSDRDVVPVQKLGR
jgi:hypothetical protein